MFETDSYLGWKLSKEKSRDHHSKYFNVNYTTNSFGFRDKKRILQKENNKFRILLYGDSQIFGWGNPAEKRFSNLLEKSLSNTEIWNLGVPAYGLDQQILLYKRDTVDADAVIFFVFEYTLTRISYDYLYQKNKPRFVVDNSEDLKIIPPKNPSLIKNFIDSAIRWMYLPFFLEKKISILSGKPGTVGHLSKFILKPKSKIADLENRIILFAKDLAGSRNDSMIILVNSYTLRGKEVKDFCNQNGILCMDVNLNEKKDDLIIGSEDGHWNSKANEIIFRYLMPEIKQLVEEKSESNHLIN